MANIIQLKDSANAVFYPQTHEKAVIDANGVNLETKLANITTPSYVVAWDGASTPVVANIPAGVTVTYNTTSYTGTLAASASTANKTYLVSTGTTDNYNRYVTQLNGSTYSWQNLGSTEIDLSDYATKEELGQLDQKVDELEGAFDIEESYNLFDKSQALNDGYIKSDGTIGGNSSYKYSYAIPVTPGHYYLLSGRNLPTSTNVRCLDASNNPLKVLVASTGAEYSTWGLPKEDGSGGAVNGQFKVPSGAVSFQFNAVWDGEGDVDQVMLIDLGTTYSANPSTPAYEPFGYITRLKDSSLPEDLVEVVSEIDEKVNGKHYNGTHTFSSAETVYYFDGLSIAQGDTIKVKVSGTAVRSAAWLVSNIGAASPGLGSVKLNGDYVITAPGAITKIGVRVYTLTTAGTIVLDVQLESKLDKTVGNLSDLHTTDKDNVVDAINEVADGLDNLEDDVSEISTSAISYNLFDKSAIVNGYVKPADGSLVGTSDSNYKSSPLIPVTPGHYYYLSGRSSMGSMGIRCLESNGTTVMKVKIAKSGPEAELDDYKFPNHNGDGAAYNGQFKVPSGAAFVQFTVIFGGSGSVDDVMLIDLGTAYRLAPYVPPYKAYGTEMVSIAKPSIGDVFKLKGKKIRIFGGSVADYCNRFGGTTVMEELLGAEILDSAVSGAGYCSKSGMQTSIVDGQPVFPEWCIPDQVDKATASGQEQYDVYLLWSSANDAAFPVGDPSDYTSADNYDVQKLVNQCGGMNYCIKKLQTFAPQSHIIIVGSMKWFSSSNGKPPISTIRPLVDGQEGVAALQSLPFYSLYANAGVNEHNLATFFVWTEDVEGTVKAAPYGDGTHPNSWAYQNVLAPKIAKQIVLLF